MPHDFFEHWFDPSGSGGRGGMGHHGRQHFNRFFSQMMGPGQRIERGELRFLILHALSDKARNGYDIMQEIERRSEGLYKPSTGVLYPTLQALEDGGYIDSLTEGEKKYYELTEVGCAELDHNRDYVEEIYSRLRWPSLLFTDERFTGLYAQLAAILRMMRFALISVQRGQNDPEILGEIREVLRETAESIERIVKRKGGES
jgi:DNA-binding PadR family transcriptional regulator